jgi:pimeloyl-ACP methyl ester carboxylesterase
MAEVLFLHGLESNPTGSKAMWLKSHFDAYVPALDTSTFAGALTQAREAVRAAKPKVVVGSSFGGALLLALVREGAWTGPCVFLAQAAQKLGAGDALPEGTRAVLLHADDDDVVPLEDSVALAATGGPGVRLIVVPGGGHRLSSTLEDGTLEAVIREILAR